MDWWLLSPQNVAALADTGVDALWIDIDPHTLERRERSNTWFFGASTDPDRMFGNFMARSVWANSHYPSQARESGFPVLHQPGDRTVADLVDEAIELLAHRRSIALKATRAADPRRCDRGRSPSARPGARG